MFLSVHPTPSDVRPADILGRSVVVIDVLRASTTIATALWNGARAVIPVGEPAEALQRAAEFPRTDVLLTGERHSVIIPGFDLGNSPLEFTRSRVAGKTVVLTTTNGTRALLGAVGVARDVLVGSYVNFSVVLSALRSALQQGTDVGIVCAGSHGRFSLEDAACAGRFVRLLTRTPGWGTAVQTDDAADAALTLENDSAEDFARLFADADHGRALRDAGFEADLTACGALDTCPVVPAWSEGALRSAGFR